MLLFECLACPDHALLSKSKSVWSLPPPPPPLCIPPPPPFHHVHQASSGVTGELLSSEGAYVLELKRGVSLYMSPLLLLSLHDSCVTEAQVQQLFSNWTTLVRQWHAPPLPLPPCFLHDQPRGYYSPRPWNCSSHLSCVCACVYALLFRLTRTLPFWPRSGRPQMP